MAWFGGRHNFSTARKDRVCFEKHKPKTRCRPGPLRGGRHRRPGPREPFGDCVRDWIAWSSISGLAGCPSFQLRPATRESQHFPRQRGGPSLAVANSSPQQLRAPEYLVVPRMTRLHYERHGLTGLRFNGFKIDLMAAPTSGVQPRQITVERGGDFTLRFRRGNKVVDKGITAGIQKVRFADYW